MRPIACSTKQAWHSRQSIVIIMLFMAWDKCSWDYYACCTCSNSGNRRFRLLIVRHVPCGEEKLWLGSPGEPQVGGQRAAAGALSAAPGQVPAHAAAHLHMPRWLRLPRPDVLLQVLQCAAVHRLQHM